MSSIGHQTQSIDRGVLVFLGIEGTDSNEDVKYMTQKLIKLRIFNDSNDKMNLSIQDIDGEIMVISQFTLCGDTQKGNRPSYINAMRPDNAEILYNHFVNDMRDIYRKIKTGVFQANMDVSLVNDGPVTLILRSKT
tara:strand:+ start:408 stop:815 length:408 start_codon:yes stop_codon:yes gene_type:complete